MSNIDSANKLRAKLSKKQEKDLQSYEEVVEEKSLEKEVVEEKSNTNNINDNKNVQVKKSK